MSKLVTSISFIALLICLAFGGSESKAQAFGKITYTCPPCGCEGDSLSLDKPGKCPFCSMEMVEQSELKNVAVFIYSDIQLADLAGAYSVFEAARTFNVYTVAASPEPIVTSYSELNISPKYTFENCPQPDILIIPGGTVGHQLNNPKVIKWIKNTSQEAKIVLSVCTGAFILAKTGLIDGLAATVLEDDIEQLREAAPKVKTVSGKRFVDNGKYLSAAGPVTGIDAALHILAKIFGNNKRAKAIEEYLDYHWQSE